MNKIKMITYNALLRLRTWWKSIHIILFFLYVWLLCDIYLRPVTAFIQSVQVNASPYGFVFLIDRLDFVLLFFLGIVFAFGDVPFINNTVRYTVLRTGILTWTEAQVFYFWICSFLFMAASMAISLIPLAGYLEFQTGWGKIYGTMAQTSIGHTFLLLLKPNYQIMLDYNPLTALLCIFIIGCLLICLIGKILFLFSLWYEKIIGVTIVLGFILFSAAAEALSGFRANFFSPFSWIRLSRLAEFRGQGLPVMSDAICILVIFHLGISVIIYLKSIKKDFHC